MSKKSTSVTFEETTIQVVNEICEATKPTPSFSRMTEHLVKTNPVYVKQEKKGKQNKNTKKKK